MVNDSCVRPGADKLAATIREYWFKRTGQVVNVELIEAGFTPAMRSGRVDIRSDMVNGLPRRVQRSKT